jgi:hypothetical protein
MPENPIMSKTDKTDELEFQCPLCGQELVAGLNLAGQEIFCPGCNQVINIPEPQPPELPPITVIPVAVPDASAEAAAAPAPGPSDPAPAPAEGGVKKLSLKLKKS